MEYIRPEIDRAIKKIRYTYNTKDQVEALNKYLHGELPLPDDTTTLPRYLQGMTITEYQRLFRVYWILYSNIVEVDEDTESQYYY